MLAIMSATAAPGDPDPSFGTGGKVLTRIDGVSTGVKSVAVQSDGKILATGGYGNFLLVRYNPDGSLDQSFGMNGVLKTFFSVSGDSSSETLAVQPDGRIVVVGTVAVNLRTYFAAARFNSDGTFDTGFGNQGKTVMTFNPAATELSETVYGLARQTDGKLVLLGQSGSNFVVFRLNANGTPDTSFGTDGFFSTNFVALGSQRYRTNNILVQTDNKIIVGGIENFNGQITGTIIRLNANGTPDTGFAANGYLRTYQQIPANRRQYFDWSSVGLQSDGKIIAGGTTLRRMITPNSPPNSYYFQGELTLLRYHPNGTPDPAFGSNGVVLRYSRKSDDYLYALVIGNDDRIYAGGTFGNILRNRYFHPATHDFDFLTGRFNADGGIDPVWGAGGLTTTDFGANLSEAVNDLAIQPDGKIVAGGDNFTNNTTSDFVIARYLTH